VLAPKKSLQHTSPENLSRKIKKECPDANGLIWLIVILVKIPAEIGIFHNNVKTDNFLAAF
jgi:hypothetical protein